MKLIKMSFIGNKAVVAHDARPEVIKEQLFNVDDKLSKTEDLTFKDIELLITKQLNYNIEHPLSLTIFSNQDTMEKEDEPYTRALLAEMIKDYPYYNIHAGEIEREDHPTLDYLHIMFYNLGDEIESRLADMLTHPASNVRFFGEAIRKILPEKA